MKNFPVPDGIGGGWLHGHAGQVLLPVHLGRLMLCLGHQRAEAPTERRHDVDWILRTQCGQTIEETVDWRLRMFDPFDEAIFQGGQRRYAGATLSLDGQDVSFDLQLRGAVQQLLDALTIDGPGVLLID